MIKKSLLVALILLGVHALVATIDPPPANQYTLQENLVKAEAFIYSESKDNLIVGSSLSEHLVMDSLSSYFNLSFAGLGVFDGLQIILNHEKLPSQILIEMNVVHRGPNENFLSIINSSVLGFVKKYLPSSRARYQPVGITGGTLINGLKTDTKQSEGKEAENVNFEQILKVAIAQNSVIPDEKMMKERFDELRLHVSALKKKGVSVIFFEMPVNPSICNLARPKMIREYFQKYFSVSENNYIKISDCSNYKTSDGVHLTRDESLRFTRYLRTQLETMVLKRQ